MATKALPTWPKTAKARYDQLSVDRQPYLQVAYECARLTIPALFPQPVGKGVQAQLITPFQGVGAEGVNNLAAKQMLALFPPGSSWFRLTMDDYVLEQLAAQAGAEGDARAEFEAALAKMERAVMNRMEQKGARMSLFEGFQQLAVAGNGLLYVAPDGAFKLFRLSQYVVKRDAAGTPLETIVKEDLDRDTLSDAAKSILLAKTEPTTDEQKDESVELYTRVVRDGKRWVIVQELEGQVVPGSHGTYPLDKNPWLPLRFKAIAGEDYGRGFVEERLGDLRSLESLTQSLVEGTAISAKTVFGVNEAGVTSKKAIADAANGEVIDGDLEKDVTVLRVDKAADFSTAFQLVGVIQKRLERAFLLLSGVQRDAERVTAEEIRAVVNELETTHGGFYSTFAQELQHPLVVTLLSQMARNRELPHLPKGTVAPQIVTGLDGLGRSSDLGKLDALLERLTKTLGPEACAQRLSVDGLVKRYGAALGADFKDLIKSDAAIQQETQDAQKAEVAKAAIGPGINAMSKAQQAQQQNAAPEQ